MLSVRPAFSNCDIDDSWDKLDDIHQINLSAGVSRWPATGFALRAGVRNLFDSDDLSIGGWMSDPFGNSYPAYPDDAP